MSNLKKEKNSQKAKENLRGLVHNLRGIGVAILSADWASLDLVRTVTTCGLIPTNFVISIKAWSPVGESTSVTFFPSAYTAYPVTGPEAGGLFTGSHVTNNVPSCGPGSTWIS